MNFEIEWPDEALKVGLELAISAQNNDGLCLIDVGAHYGETYNTYKKFANEFSYIGFEPDPDTYSILKKNFENLKPHENHKIINSAVGPNNGTISFIKTQADAVSGVLPPEDELNNRVPSGDHIIIDKFDVPVKTLDYVLNEFSTVSLLKIDTEGFDLECLKGAEESLNSSKINVIMCESFFVKYRQGQCYFWDIASFLKSKNYYFINLYDSRNTTQGRLYTANGLWISKRVAGELNYL